MPMQWQTMQIPLAGGLAQSTDDRARNPPQLDRAVDVQFDEQGGLQTRKPFASIGTNIYGGGTLSGVRRLAVLDNELVAFTATAIYAWNAANSVWVLRTTHLGCKIDETPVFATTGDQQCCDRAELNGTIVYTWYDVTAGAGFVWVAALDKTTGAVLLSPTPFAAPTGRPRVIASGTKILLFFASAAASGALVVYAIDPASPGTALAGASTTVLAAAAFSIVPNNYYDVCATPTAGTVVVAATRGTNTSYTVATVTTALVVTAVTKARTCDGPISIACDPAGNVQIVRTSVRNIQGDLLTSALVDTYTAQAIGTFPNLGTTLCYQLTAAFRSVQTSGTYRCYVYWSSNLTTGIVSDLQQNWVSSTNTLGTATYVLYPTTNSSNAHGYDIASRAFDYNGSVYVHLQFGGESDTSSFVAALQNTYFLYRDDGLLVAKELPNNAAGFSQALAYVAIRGYLPGVALVSGSTGYAWCGSRRRLIPLADSTGVPARGQAYTSRAPQDIAITFDSNEARRSVQLGRTLYITGGEILQYDGIRTTEVGFHIYPWYLDQFGLAVGLIPDGAYTYKATFRSENGRAETDRSTTATYHTTAVSGGGPYLRNASMAPLGATHKTDAGTTLAVAEVWRTVINATSDTPYYVTTSRDPSIVGGIGNTANGYVTCRTGSFLDNLTDALLTVREPNPENGSVLESIAPPAATMIIANQSRIFLAGVPGQPTRIWYSKLRGDGEIAAFNDSLVADIPSEAGAITALAFQEENLIAFTANGIYVLPNTGFDNTGGGTNYGPARIVSTDCGAVNHESVCYSPMGLVFKSAKGWYLLRGWDPQYIGAPVSDYDAETIVAIHVMEGQHQIRALSSSRMLVFDYLVNQWAEWSIAGGVDAALWNGTYVYATSAGVLAEQTSYAALTYGLDVETPWIKLADLQGAGRVRWLEILGEYRSTHALRLRIARDYLVGTAVAATFSTRAMKDYLDSPLQLRTSGAPWTATLTWATTGEAGNLGTLSFTCELTAGASAITIHDNQVFDAGAVAFIPCTNNVGIRIQVSFTGALPTIAQLEAAINTSALCQVTTADPSPTKTITSANPVEGTIFQQFSGGVDATTATYEEDQIWTGTPTVVGGPEQIRVGAAWQRCEAIKLRITAIAPAVRTANLSQYLLTPPTGEALKLTGLGLEIGIERGLYRRLPATQKA